MDKDLTQYRLTAPGGYEQFYGNAAAAHEAFRCLPNATLEKATPGTDDRWVTVARKAGPGEYKTLRKMLRLNL